MEADLPDTVDEAALRRARAVATLLDESIRIPGTKYHIGVDPLLSALPTPAGDVVGAGLSMYIVLEAANLGVPYTTIVRMIANVGIDTAIGAVPIVGALFDAVWKANSRNVSLIERHIASPAARPDAAGTDEGDPISVDISEAE